MDLSGNSRLIVGIESIKILLADGAALETILSSNAEKDFGELSSGSRRALAAIKRGDTIDAAMERSGQCEEVRSIFRLLKTQDNKLIIPELDNISAGIISKKKSAAGAFVTRFEALATFIIVILLVPLFTILLQLLQTTSSLILDKPLQIPDFVDGLAMLISYLILIALLWVMRYRE